MGGFYEPHPNSEFVEIVIQEPQDYVKFAKDDLHAVMAHTSQQWPTKPTHGDLMATLHKYGASAEIMHNYYMNTRVLVSVGDLKLVYDQGPSGENYRLLWIEPLGANTPAPSHKQDHVGLASKLIHAMPGLNEQVASPCSCLSWGKGDNTVQAVIIHLNDRHHPTLGSLRADPWSRERIAQWTETLPFDLTLDPDRPESKPRPVHDQTHFKEYQKSLKALMGSMLISQNSFLKSMALMSDAGIKATDTLHDLSGAMKKSFEVTFTGVDPSLYEMLTGQPHPDDKKEEA
jgi:hypothetical protein